MTSLKTQQGAEKRINVTLSSCVYLCACSMAGEGRDRGGKCDCVRTPSSYPGYILLNEDLLTLVSEELVPGNWMGVSSLGSLAFCAGQKENMYNQALLKHQELAFCLTKEHSKRDETLWPELSREFSVVLTTKIIESLVFCWFV